MEHVLIVGGSGFVGQTLARKFITLGYRVTVFDVLQGRFTHENVRYYTVDVQSGKLPTLPQCHCIINLAGAPISRPFTEPYKKTIWTSRVITTRSLRLWVETQSWQPNMYVGASAVGYYGTQEPEDYCTESSRPGTDTLARVCVDWEREHHAFEKLGIPVAILRQGVIIGSGGYISQTLPWFRRGLKITLGNGTNYVPWIAVRDLMNIYTALCTAKLNPNTYNAVSNQYIRQSDIVSTLGALTGAYFDITIPLWILRLRFGELANVMTANQKVVSSPVLREYVATTLADALESAIKS